MCTYQAGAAIVAASCTTYSGGGFPSNDVTAVAGGTIDSEDVLVVGTSAGLFVPTDPAGGTTGVPLNAAGTTTTGAISGIAQGIAFYSGTNERKGVFWFTSPTAELRVYWPDDDHVSARDDGVSGREMNAVAVGQDDLVWIACNTGLARYVEQTMAPAEANTGWVPAGNGYTVASTGGDLPSNDLTAVVTARVLSEAVPHDLVWIGSDSGLTRFDTTAPTSFMTLTTDEGMPSDSVIAIALLPNGDKLISTDAGLALYDQD